MKNKIYCILGEYKNSRVKIIILSKKSYDIKLDINKNSTKERSMYINIQKYKANEIILENIKEGYKYNIFFINNDDTEVIDKLEINLEKNPFNNVKIVNCDSNFGIETNTWSLINKNFGVVFHIGDFLYNDSIFRKYFNHYIKTNNIEYEKMYKELYDNYIVCITRKLYYLKNNFNYVMTDDHETVDDAYYEKNKDNKIFMKIYKMFKEVEIKILQKLRFEIKPLEFVYDDTNKTIYILNHENIIINNDIIKKYNIYENIKNYKNIFFLERKCFTSSSPSLISNLIFQEKELIINNDNLYKILEKLHNKNIYILSGDYHIISSMDIYNKSNNKICSVKNIGAINTCVDIFKTDIFLTSNVYTNEHKEIVNRNGFININYKNNKLIFTNLINNKTNIIFNIINNIITGIKFVL